MPYGDAPSRDFTSDGGTDQFRRTANEPITIAKSGILSAKAGSSTTKTINLFNADAPYGLRLVELAVVVVDGNTGRFDGANGALTAVVQRSTDVPSSPSSTFSPSYETVISSTDISSVADNGLAYRAPDSTAQIDQSKATIPKGGTLRVQIAGQVEDAGADTDVEVLVVAKLVPTEF